MTHWLYVCLILLKFHKSFWYLPHLWKNSRIFLIKIIPKIDENSLIIFIFWQNWFSEAISVCSTINSGKNVNGGSMGRRKERDRRTFFISGWVVLRQCYDFMPPFPIMNVLRFSHTLSEFLTIAWFNRISKNKIGRRIILYH